MRLPGPVPRVVAQVRSLLDRSLLGLLIGFSVLLMLLDKADMKLANYLTGRVGDAAVPILQVLGEPVAAVRGGIDRVGALLAVYEENERLRTENRRLLAWQAEASRLAVQNRALRGMLDLPEDERAMAAATARVVADPAGVFVRTLLVDAGMRRGVGDGMAATTPAGLAGRVVGVGCCSARVLLITDFNSRIPVLIERSGDHALLIGDNGPEPALRFLPMGAEPRPGDQVVTSGQGGLLPAGVPIGRIASVSPEKVAVQPYVDWTRLDYLTLLRQPSVPPP